MDMLISGLIIIGSALIVSCNKIDKMDGWIIGAISGMLAGATIHFL